MKKHLQDFRGFSTSESSQQERAPTPKEYWVLYRFENNDSHIIGLYDSHSEALEVWYDSVLERFSDRIKEMMKKVLSKGDDLETIRSRDPDFYNRLENISVWRASEMFRTEARFVVQSMNKITEGGPLYTQIMESPAVDNRIKRKIQRMVGMRDMFERP
jgi:hypothetical protein